jgi:hypothetical protein
VKPARSAARRSTPWGSPSVACRFVGVQQLANGLTHLARLIQLGCACLYALVDEQVRQPVAVALEVDRVDQALDESERLGRVVRQVVARHDTSVILSPVARRAAVRR